MSSEIVGFLGGGRIARIMLGGWRLAEAMPGEVVVAESDSGVVDRLLHQFPTIEAASAQDVASRSRWLFVAVHPPHIGPVLAEIREALGKDTVVVSLAPKVTLEKLSEGLGGHPSVARVIPNAASLVMTGYNPVAFGPGLSSSDREELTTLLAPLGECPLVPENQLEAFAVLTAMGPTYAWFQWQILEELAQSFGIPADQSRSAIKAMLNGALTVYFDAGLTVDEVCDLIPVRPLKEDEPAIQAMLEQRLTAIFEKIKP